MLARPGKPNEIPEHPVYRPLLGRAGWPDDIAPLARLLLGPGGRYITGQIINVSGGTYFGTCDEARMPLVRHAAAKQGPRGHDCDSALALISRLARRNERDERGLRRRAFTLRSDD